jgi:hypothetical protein
MERVARRYKYYCLIDLDGTIGTPSGHALMPMQRLARRYTEQQSRSG